ncbi:MAG TPA: DUF6089 family protein, partial [Phnomibacter sp.]|nr:DUF6089 family protein [Phnomibacter sp.]
LAYVSQHANAQRLDVDLFGGISNYQGDLQPIFFTLQNANPGAAVILKYGIHDNFYIRGGFSFGSVAASDAKNKPSLQPRNLSFRSGIKEFHTGLEYRIINPEKLQVTPYVFAGVGVFMFNPYAYGANGNQRIYLQPLSTEGQGLSEYPDRKPYNLTQFCIPYGAGIKWQINCNLNVGFEFRQTMLFTDYLDDVSKTYVDQTALLRARGQLAVEMAYRRDEYDGRPYPNAGAGRGNPEQKDWYYFVGATVGLKLNDCETGGFSLGGIFRGRGGGGAFRGGSSRKIRSRVGCPRF